AVATNAAHGVVWSDLRVEMVFGVATVSYTFGPWAYVIVAVEMVLVASAVFLLVDTLLSYGPLYRRETAAVALSAVPPGVALVAWTLEVGPVPQLQLAPIMFVPHVLLDAYAFNRAEMFDRYPTTSRAADRTAIDDLSDPIIALALDRRVVRLNAAAESLLAVTNETAHDRPLEAFLDVPIDTESSNEVSLSVGARERTYTVSTSPLTDPNGIHVGYTVVLSDITDRERRRQQLSVLNRILRHNLRNDAGLVAGYGEVLGDRLDDPELEQMADAIERRGGALAALGEKASTVERLLTDSTPTTVAVDEVVTSAVASARTTTPKATVELATTVAHPTASLRAGALQAVVENTVENALEHHDGAGTERADGGPWVKITLQHGRRDGSDNSGEDTDSSAASSAGTQTVSHGQSTADPRAKTGAAAGSETDSDVESPAAPDADAGADHDEQFVLIIEDDGPGIPGHELSAVDAGEETALEHGSGLGLWVIEWGADALGADVEYAHREPRGTRITVGIPTPN
ncbi:MAG: histidine kinase-, DNA gyrase B-, and HSP90-like ATPase, partial [halophilic archaeon J07HX5]